MVGVFLSDLPVIVKHAKASQIAKQDKGVDDVVAVLVGHEL